MHYMVSGWVNLGISGNRNSFVLVAGVILSGVLDMISVFDFQYAELESLIGIGWYVDL